MAAETFDDALFKLTCSRLTQAALRYYAKADSPIHPSWPDGALVLEGTSMVHIARNGFITIAAQR